jgi:hypothetical protein
MQIENKWVDLTPVKKPGERELARIAISLRTRELSKARTIAAHLVVASDGIVRQEGREIRERIIATALLIFVKSKAGRRSVTIPL